LTTRQTLLGVWLMVGKGTGWNKLPQLAVIFFRGGRPRRQCKNLAEDKRGLYLLIVC
jgi:hypothetical protein